MNKVLFRAAGRENLPDIVRMLADDELGSRREKEDPLPETYYGAFEQINSESNHQLVVAELDRKVIGTLHLIFIPSISYQGGLRAQIGNIKAWGLEAK